MIIGLVYVIIAIVALGIENSELVTKIKEKIPYLFIPDYETVQSMLSTFIGGIISLTVFSFSMVMVVLAQAFSNFSPRLLPLAALRYDLERNIGNPADKGHILGHFDTRP